MSRIIGCIFAWVRGSYISPLNLSLLGPRAGGILRFVCDSISVGSEYSISICRGGGCFELIPQTLIDRGQYKYVTCEDRRDKSEDQAKHSDYAMFKTAGLNAKLGKEQLLHNRQAGLHTIKRRMSV